MSLKQTGPASILAALLVLGGCHAANTSSPSKDDATDVRAYGPVAPASTSPGPTAHPSPAPSPDTRPLLVCFGDSLTAGYGTNPGQSYPDFLQEDLDHAGYRYRVVNEGTSGATSKDGVASLPHILSLHAAVVIVEFGGNDGLRGLSAADLRANLDRIVSALQASGSKVLLAGITLPPDYGPDYIAQFTATYPALAKKYRLPLYPFLLQGVFGVDGMMQPDRTHATAQGNQIVAQNLLPTLEPLLKK